MRHLLLLPLLAAACSRGYRDPEDSAALKADIEDRNVATRVRVALGEDPQTAPYDTIHVSCEKGIVTLDGAVDRAAVRQRAAEVAQTVGGVRDVSNKINVRDASGRRR